MGGTRCQALEVHIELGSAVLVTGDLRHRLCRAPLGGQECGLMFPDGPRAGAKVPPKRDAAFTSQPCEDPLWGATSPQTGDMTF